KNLHVYETTPTRNPVTKVREIIGALTLARLHSKDEILTWYLDSVFYGSAAYGAEAASQRYFGKPASQLTLGEASLLAGIPSAPGTYNVSENFEATRDRQHEVLHLMVMHGYINQEQADAAFAEPLNFQSINVPIEAPHFDM